MSVYEIISRKRDGQELNTADIQEFVRGVTEGTVPDYQASAWLMAVFLRGMSDRETLDLTLAMRDSGRRVDLDGISLAGYLPIDKHSTGGVGDKTTLVVAPILAAAGVPILKMSGRGLGFSGGTVDKLESIPGLRTNLSIEEAVEQVRSIGIALIGQTADLAPADKILYALRDVTATVDSIPLICASIMSKKLASGGQAIILDVKYGSGSFMKNPEDARRLARALVSLGSKAGVPTSAYLTSMEEPLGHSVGNAIEVREALDALNIGTGGNESDYSHPTRLFLDLCITLAAEGFEAAGRAAGTEARELAWAALKSGAALAKFEQMVKTQGGPSDFEAILREMPKAQFRFAVRASAWGCITSIDAEAIGRLAVRMGAGREKKTDTIDPSVGIHIHHKVGDIVDEKTAIGTLLVRETNRANIDEFADAFRSAYTISESGEASPPSSLILEHITA